MLSVISFSCFSSFQLPKLVAERIAVKSQLDAIFSDPIAQVIIQKEESLSNMMASLFLNVKRFNEIKKIAPNENKGALESNKNSMLYTLWQLVCNPLKNPLKRLIVRELHPLKRALSSDYFNATNMVALLLYLRRMKYLNHMCLNFRNVIA
jgi:hypothetical protein